MIAALGNKKTIMMEKGTYIKNVVDREVWNIVSNGWIDNNVKAYEDGQEVKLMPRLKGG